MRKAPLNVDAILATELATTPFLPAAIDSRNQQPPANPANPRRHAMASALGAAWPAKGRHEAQLALAGALRGEGWSSEEAVEFLCTVCRAAGDENRTKREATVRHTWGREPGAPLTGWNRLKSHVDPVVVDAARSALGRDAEWTERTTRRLAEVSDNANENQEHCTNSSQNADGTVTAGPFVFRVGGLDAEQPPIVWLIDSLICRADVAMLVAHGGSLKTWLAFSLALSVATGRPWLNKFVSLRGRVGILDFESGDFEVVRRLKLLGAKDGDIADRLLRCSYSAAQLVDPETWIALAALKLDLLVVDSFNAASPELDENDARAALMLTHAGRFANATGCTVIFVHHARKGTGGDQREAVRGSTALFAACDRIFKFDEPERKDGGVIASTMRSIKDGAGRSPAAVRVELSDQGLRFVEASADEVDENGDDKTTPDRNRKLVISTLKAHPAGVPQTRLVDLMKGKRERKFELLAALMLSGLIVEGSDVSTGKKQVMLMLRPGIEL